MTHGCEDGHPGRGWHDSANGVGRLTDYLGCEPGQATEQYRAVHGARPGAHPESGEHTDGRSEAHRCHGGRKAARYRSARQAGALHRDARALSLARPWRSYAAVSLIVLACVIVTGCVQPTDLYSRVGALEARAEPEVDALFQQLISRGCKSPVDIINRNFNTPEHRLAVYLLCPDIREPVDQTDNAVELLLKTPTAS